MADLLIRGMGMPETCYNCDFVEIGSWLGAQDGWEHFCSVDGDELRTVYHGEKPDWCPLVEVPTHGRLIDAGELRGAMYHEAFEKDSDMQRWDSGCWIRYKMFEKAIETAPTVIEASEEGE